MRLSKQNFSKRLNAVEKQHKLLYETKAYLSSIDVCEHIAPAYVPIHDDITTAAHQYYNLPGGRGSGKISFCALEIVDGIMKDTAGNSNAIVFRHYGNTLRDSVYSQIAWAIDTLNVSEYWRSSVSPMIFTYIPTGAQILFRGLDDASKLKSIKPRRGIFRFVWLEEFSELPGENFTRSVMQSVQRGGSDFIVFRSFNPPISASNWANIFIQRSDPRALTLHTSYLDMPPEWLGNDFILEAERLKEINEQAYRHEYLGEAIGSGGEVFPNVTVREITDNEINDFQYIYCGVDFGFSVDPVALIRLAYDRKRETVYMLSEIYKRGMSNAELAEEIKARGYDKTGVTIKRNIWGDGIKEYEEQQLIICDSAEPKSIYDLQQSGLKTIACKKYPGSVLYGIKWLQRRQIVIDPIRTPNAHKEFVNYEYMTTKDGEFLADVPDKNNHLIDCTRYALDRLINNSQHSA